MQELKQEITTTLNREKALEIFNQEKILLGNTEYIPQYRVIELFGEQIAIFIDKHTHYKGYLIAGSDYNIFNSEPPLKGFTLAGYLKIVSEHNYILAIAEELLSKAKPVIDRIDKARRKRLEID